jgi:hypothetical protein
MAVKLLKWLFVRPTLVERARELSPFNSLPNTDSPRIPHDWRTYRSEEHEVSFPYPTGWSVHLENAALENIAYPWIEAVVLVGGMPPDAYLAFHVSLRRRGAFQGNWKHADGSEGPVSSRAEITSIRRQCILASFHSAKLLEERDTEVAGLSGQVLSYRHFGLKKATNPLNTAVWEHSCLLCGDGITYDLIIECSESLVEKYQQPLQLVLAELQLPKIFRGIGHDYLSVTGFSLKKPITYQ